MKYEEMIRNIKTRNKIQKLCFILDFDYTLAYTSKQNNTYLYPYTKAMLDLLAKSSNVDMYIVSLRDRDSIVSIFRRSGIDTKMFKSILGYKNTHDKTKDYMRVMNETKNHKHYVFDDNPRHIKEARKLGLSAIQVTEKKGLTPEIVSKLL